MPQIALITGAASGIGKAIAQSLAGPDNILLLADINTSLLHQFMVSIKDQCKQIDMYAGDITDAQFRALMVTDIMRKYNNLNVLVNNAGTAHPFAEIPKISPSEFDRTFDLNVKIPFLLMRSLVPILQPNRGTIFNIGSLAHINGYKEHAIYAASKAALISLTNTLNLEENGVGVKGVSVLPGRTNTAMNRALRGGQAADDSQPPELVGQAVRDYLLMDKGEKYIVVDDNEIKYTDELPMHY